MSLKLAFLLKHDGLHIPADFTGVFRIVHEGIAGNILPHLPVGVVQETGCLIAGLAGAIQP